MKASRSSSSLIQALPACIAKPLALNNLGDIGFPSKKHTTQWYRFQNQFFNNIVSLAAAVLADAP